MKYKIHTNAWIEIWRYIKTQSECIVSIIIYKDEQRIHAYDSILTIKNGTSTGIKLINNPTDSIFIITESISVNTLNGLSNLPSNEEEILEYITTLGLLPPLYTI